MFSKSNRARVVLTLTFLILMVIFTVWAFSYQRPLAIELPISAHGDSSRMFFFRGKWWTHLEGLYPFHRRIGDWILFAEHPSEQDWFLSTVDCSTGDLVRFKIDYPGYFVFSFGFTNYFVEKAEKGVRVRYLEPDAELSIVLNPSDGSVIYEKIKLPTQSDK